jgi:hypothetical protein
MKETALLWRYIWYFECVRNILPGDVFDASLIQILGFTIQNSLPVEVVLTENTTDWNNRLRFQMANANATEMNVLLINLLVH